MTNDLFKLVMAELRRVIKLRHPDLEHLLYLDRLQSHLQADVVRECAQDKLYIAFFPAHTSEFLRLRTQRRSRRCMQC